MGTELVDELYNNSTVKQLISMRDEEKYYPTKGKLEKDVKEVLGYGRNDDFKIDLNERKIKVMINRCNWYKDMSVFIERAPEPRGFGKENMFHTYAKGHMMNRNLYVGGNEISGKIAYLNIVDLGDKKNLEICRNVNDEKTVVSYFSQETLVKAMRKDYRYGLIAVDMYVDRGFYKLLDVNYYENCNVESLYKLIAIKDACVHMYLGKYRMGKWKSQIQCRSSGIKVKTSSLDYLFDKTTTL